MRRGLTKSCGCFAKEKLDTFNANNTKDETGNKYDRLTVLSRNLDPKFSCDGRAMWNCQCECGNITVVSGKNLRQGHTRSCGCLSEENKMKLGERGKNNGGKQFKDMTGLIFGKLTVISRAENTSTGQAKWNCRCECGNQIVVIGSSLRNGNTTSCGCINSKGELKINQLLLNNSIKFESQFKIYYNDTIYRFDYAILKNDMIKYCIEYDGIQHFKPVEYFGGEFGLQETQERDIIKNQWCKENNIPLIRIPYTHLKDLCIEDLKLETSQFIVKH